MPMELGDVVVRRDSEEQFQVAYIRATASKRVITLIPVDGAGLPRYTVDEEQIPAMFTANE